MLKTSVQGVTTHEVMYGDQLVQLVILDNHRLIRRTAVHNKFAVLPRDPAELAKLPSMHIQGDAAPPSAGACTLLRALLDPAARRVYRYIRGHAYRFTERTSWGGAAAELYVFLGPGQVFNAHLDEPDVRLSTDVWCWVGTAESRQGFATSTLMVNPEVLDDPRRGVAARCVPRPNGPLHDCGRVLPHSWTAANPVSIDGAVLVNLGTSMSTAQGLAALALSRGVGT